MQKILPILLVIFIVACDGHKHQDALLDRADSQLDADPRAVLSFVDSIARDCDLTRSQRMRLELIRAQAQNKAIVNFTTDSLVLQLAEYYENHGTPNDRMKAYYMVGCAYRDLEDAPTALKYCRMAVEQADTTSRDCDLKTLSRIHGQMGDLYHDVAAFENEQTENLTAEHLSWVAQDTLSALMFATIRAAAYSVQENYDMARTILDSVETFDYIQRYPHIFAENIFPQRICAALACNDTERAGKLLHQYELAMDFTPTSSDADIINENYHDAKAEYYRKTGQLDSAIYQSRRLLARAHLFDSEEGAYKGLFEAYNMLHNLDSTTKYAKLYCEANDYTTKHRSCDQILQLQAIYNYSKAQEKASASQQEAANIRLLLVVFLAFFCFIGVFSYECYKRRVEQERMRLKDSKREYLQLLNRLQEKNNELDELRRDATNYQRSIELEISELQRSISRYRAEAPDIEKWDEEHAIYKNASAQHLHEMAARGLSATYGEIESLVDVIRSEFPTYYNRISNSEPPLFQREIHVCVLMRLRFISSEISILLGASAQTITNTKSSINKKLFNTSGARTLEKHLMEI